MWWPPRRLAHVFGISCTHCEWAQWSHGLVFEVDWQRRAADYRVDCSDARPHDAIA